VNILSIFRRKQPGARRALTPAEARQQQIAALRQQLRGE